MEDLPEVLAKACMDLLLVMPSTFGFTPCEGRAAKFCEKNEKYLQKCKDLATKMGDTFIKPMLYYFDVEHAVQIHQKKTFPSDNLGSA